MLYAMTTGQLPFKGTDAISTLMAVTTQEAPPPRSLNPEVPKELSSLIQRLLAKDPAKRPQTAKEVVAVLERLQPATGSARTGVHPAPLPAAPRGKSRRGLLVACGLALIAVVVAGIVFFVQTPKGTIRVEINDDAIEVVLTKTGAKIKGADKTGEIVVVP